MITDKDINEGLQKLGFKPLDELREDMDFYHLEGDIVQSYYNIFLEFHNISRKHHKRIGKIFVKALY